MPATPPPDPDRTELVELSAPRRAPYWLTALAALLAAVLAGGTLVVELTDSNGDRIPDGARVIVQKTAPPPQVPTSAAVDGPDADGKLDDRITVPPATAQAVEAELTAGQAELADPLRESGDTPATRTVPGPLAADEVPGCRTRFVGNSSSRGGVTPRIITVHQTVSRERGIASQNALTAMAARASSGVSWHLLVGRSNGLCTYTVPLALKAWTQANANPFAVGIEVEAYGDEGAYVTGAGKAKLASVVAYIARRYSIPLQHGRVVNCRVVRPGIVEHSELGICGGGHIDVTLNPGSAATYVARIAREAAGSTSTSSTGLKGYYTAAERRWIAEYDRLKRTKDNPARRRELRAAMTTQRRRIWRVAQPRPRGDGRGYGYANRQRRYRSLYARTR